MKKKRRKLRINRVIILLLFVFMICFGVILFIRSDFFSLKNIKIVNNDILTKTEVKNLSNINTGKNLFSYDIEKIKTNINKSKYIEYVKVKRRIPNSIIIDVKGSITFINSNNKDIKFEYINNQRYIEVNGTGIGNEISNKELFEMYAY